MGLDKAAASGVLKEFYLPTTREQINTKQEFLVQIERNSEDVEGLEAVLSLHVGLNEGIGSRLELEDLPEPDQQGYTKQRVPLHYHYGRIQVSGPVIRAMKSDDGSWLRAVESETKGVITNLRQDVDRQAQGSSDGVLAPTAANATATNTILLAASDVQMRHFRKKMRVDIGTVASPAAVAGNRRITAVNRAAKTITIDGPAVITAATDRVFRKGNGGTGAFQREITGIQTIVANSGALHGVDPAVEEEWQSHVKDAAAANLSDALIGEVIDEVSITSATGQLDWAITTHLIARVYAATLEAQKRTVNSLDLKGGFKGIEVGTATGRLALQSIKDAPARQVYFLSTSNLTVQESSDWEFMEEDGNVLQRITTGNGKDGYEATLFKYMELTTDERGAHGKIVNVGAA